MIAYKGFTESHDKGFFESYWVMQLSLFTLIDVKEYCKDTLINELRLYDIIST